MHCQGRAVWSKEAKPARVDVERLRRETGQVVAQLRLPKAVEETWGEYVLHPSLMEGALQACAGLMGGEEEGSKERRVPFALESLRLVSKCRREMVAWVRYSAGSEAGDKVIKLDIDLCDEDGNVCVQMRGLGWQEASLIEDRAAVPSIPAARTKVSLAPAARKEIVFIPYQQATFTRVQSRKPNSISLVEPCAVVSPENAAPRPRVSITLANAGVGLPLPGSAEPAVSSVRLFDCGKGIFSIQIAAGESRRSSVGETIAHLLEALDRIRQERSLKVVMLKGLEHCFTGGGRDEYNEAVRQGLYQTLVSYPGVLIAVMEGDAIGAGFLAAALCDLMVCSEEGRYGYSEPQSHFYATTEERILLSQRFGEVLAQDLLYGSGTATGRQLRKKGWTCPIVAGEQVDSYAERLAWTLAGKSQDALRVLKQHLVRDLAGLVEALTEVKAVALASAAEGPVDAMAGTIGWPTEHIHLDTPAEKVLVIRFCAGEGKVGIGEQVAELGRVFAQVQQSGGCRAMVLASESGEFVVGTEQGMEEEVVQEWQRLLLGVEIPVVAALEGDARGVGWLISQFCDACVYSERGVYSCAGLGSGRVRRATAVALFRYRLGESVGREVLLTGAEYSGKELEQRAGGLLVEEQGDVLRRAVEVAEGWARLPRATLAAWKEHRVAGLEKKIAQLRDAAVWEEKEEEKEEKPVVTGGIELESKVVRASVDEEGIVVVKMEDRQARNMFSEALVEGLGEVFTHIEQTPGYKVVVLTGYGSYFSCGGTKESLLAIQAGQAKFTDYRIFEAGVKCRLPVIAAMQGHGMGAGWTLGLLADVVLLSEESRYESPYMNYGFTPGAGATWVVGEKLGRDVGRESLLTGEPYSGRELQERGVRVGVLPRGEVREAAMRMARQMAQFSRRQLIGLKQQMNHDVGRVLEEIYGLELAMHEKTFVGRDDTLAQIHKNFHAEIEAFSAPQVEAFGAQGREASAGGEAQVKAAKSSGDGDVLSGVNATLRRLLANELQMRESDVDDHAQFVDLGLDSISGVTWVRKINEKYHTSIEATKVYSYPTLGQLSRYVKEEAEKQGKLRQPSARAAEEVAAALGEKLSQERLQQERSQKVDDDSPSRKITAMARRGEVGGKLTSRRSRKGTRFLTETSGSGSRIAEGHSQYGRQRIAVIGMAGQFPQARNVGEYWQNLAQGRNCITQVPGKRWDVNAYYQPGEAVAGKSNSQWAGVLEEYDCFDPLFFNISPTEAESMDPQQRLFLQACWQSIEDAGYDARVLSGSKCGVFAGCAHGDYHLLSREQQLSAQGFTGDATSILAARISYFLNLQGPCISIDTACSSSLVALAHACDSLVAGGSDLALAGGVYVMAGPEMHIKTSQAGMLSREGRCYTFDQRADGFVPGEGVGVVMLKRLGDAERDEDLIYGVIEGWGVNQDGKTNGITAPNPESQTRLEREVYERYGIDPGNIQLIEAHGTGTKLGDPIEVEGLKKAFAGYTEKREYCGLGSVKSNIGHCLGAAGIAGVIKLLLALKHRQVPPTINFERLNEHIELKGSPFYINGELQEWELKGGEKRQAAISAFGFSGTNAHMVIGEYVAGVKVKGGEKGVRQEGEREGKQEGKQEGKVVIPLSARKAEQLRERARDLLEFLEKAGVGVVDVEEMGYTLQVGREGMEERLGLVVSSVEEAKEKLRGYVEGEEEIKDMYEGQVRRGKESLSLISEDEEVKEMIVEKWMREKKVSRLAEWWVRGLELDWKKLYGEEKPRRMRLPVYGFARERYWIERRSGGGERVQGGGSAVLHPLLQRNTSDLREQRYSSRFTGEEFFLRDHGVVGEGGVAEKVLPGVAYLEMARAAVEEAWPMLERGSGVLELRDTVWAKPVVVREGRQVSIALSANDEDEIEYEVYTQEDGEEVVHCQGKAVWSKQAKPERLDLERLKGEMQGGRLEANRVYAAFRQMGLHYGPGHQGITALYLGEQQLLAQLRLPAVVEGGDDAAGENAYVLHPSLMDSALQVSIRLVGGSTLSLPLALKLLRILSPCTAEMLAWVRYSPIEPVGEYKQQLDIDLVDREGNVCVEIRGLEFSRFDLSEIFIPAKLSSMVDRPTATIGQEEKRLPGKQDSVHGISAPETLEQGRGENSYLCKWEQQPDVQQAHPVIHKNAVIICCVPFYQLEDLIIQYYQQHDCKTILIRLAETSERISEKEWSSGIHDPKGFQKCLQDISGIDVIYFLAMGEQQAAVPSLKDIADSREINEIQFLRLIKCLQQHKKGEARIDLYILTLNSHSLTGTPNNFMGAGINGLGYSLAQGNSQYQVRNLDLSLEDLQNEYQRRNLLVAIIDEPPSNRGEVYKLQSGHRYRQTFFKLRWDNTCQPGIRHKGVYVIVGGRGTVGQIITRNLIGKYGATVVWIGRNAENSEEVQASLKSFEPFGPRPLYLQADVTDLDSMQKAVRLIMEKDIEINGAIFSAMVFGNDNSIAQITEDEFRSIFDVKAQGSWVFYEALKNEPLDFMCYFSSRQAHAFLGASRSPGYTSGITFADAFVRSLQNTSAFPVGAINWGIWQASINETTRDKTADSLDALDDQKGFQYFELFVTELQRSRIYQSLCVGESRLLESLMNCSREEVITLAKAPASVMVSVSEGDVVIPRDKFACLRNARVRNELGEWFVQLLFCQIDSLMNSTGQCTPMVVSDLSQRCGVIDKYLPWWSESLNVLCQNKYLELKNGIISEMAKLQANVIRDTWQTNKERYCEDPDLRALAILVSDCMENLPDILRGRLLATDVVFPNSSMEKVEALYRDNLLADTFNEIVANSVVACLKQRLQSDSQSRLRILEIGAGTGATSAAIFAKLQAFQQSVGEYCYTDLSKAFFLHAEENYVPKYPYVRCHKLDIEQPIENQGIDFGSYDLVIAANVLHATKNIRETIRNTKAILRTDGFLILNEVSSKSLYAHLTFGLLDGWWRFEDPDLRIPNCPGIRPSGWKELLEKEGFRSVQFPAQEAHDLGYQIILAQSDGVIRQKMELAEIKHPDPIPRPGMRTKEQIQKPAPAIRSAPRAEEHVRERILECLSSVLKIHPGDIDDDIAFSDYGIDSILGVEFIQRVNKALSIGLNTAIVFEYSSLERLSRYVVATYRDQVEARIPEQVAPDIGKVETHIASLPDGAQKKWTVLSRGHVASGRKWSGKQMSREPKAKDPEIAVIGMSGIFPKAENVNEFWRNLIGGIDGVEELPATYLNQKAFFSTKKQPGKTRCKWGGILKDRDCFDPLFFNLSPKEAESMNPHQRLVLQEGWRAIEDAGYNPRLLSDSQTGIFIGAEPTGYLGESFTGYSDAIIASRLSYVLNLGGPAFVVNTGCSSSGVAIHLACESLRNRETDLALAGGANACMKQSVQILLDEIEMLSPSGCCHTFDSAADGTVVSEAVAIVVLKRLGDALRDGDLIYGVICGSGTNQDGASNGITAPNGAAQEHLIANIYKRFGINPENISYVEAHGTGTKLGDPVEANALVRAFRQFTTKAGYCAVGSAKSHIGHTGATAGVTGLIKVLLSMQHGRLPGLLHFKSLNPLIEFDGSPFYIGAEESAWNCGEGFPRMAVLNSFGHSGTNAHLVIREYPGPGEDHDPTDVQQMDDAVIVPLSAKTVEQLRQKAIDLLAFIRSGEKRPIGSLESVDLTRMAYTLQTGREAMEERLGFVVSSVDQLAEKLQSYVDGEQNLEDYEGRTKRKDSLSLVMEDADLQETVNKWISDKKLTKLLDLWVNGVQLDWGRFYGDVKPRRMRLPTYPFQKERYWAEKPSRNHADDTAPLNGNFASVEDVIDKLEKGLIEESEGAELLKTLI